MCSPRWRLQNRWYQSGQAAGPLRITTTVAFGSIWLTERLKEFIEHYPDIQVTLIVAEDELDLSMGEVDVAIRMTPPTQGDWCDGPYWQCITACLRRRFT